MKAYPLAVHLNGIAVDYRGDAGHVGQGRGGEQAQGGGEGAHGRRVPRMGEKESSTSAFLPISWRERVSCDPGSGSVLRSIKFTLHAHISVPSEPIGDMAWHPGKTRAVRPHEHLFLYFPESSGAP